jgi:exopolyphosphatase/guanosine-5'-triphosphate,3'-diphosphate pyrophosphatase
MRGAAIDVGSNTVRLLIGDTDGRTIIPRRYFRRITRLGGGFDPNTGLAAPAIARTLAAIREIEEVLRTEPVSSLRMVGTEALRRAGNNGRVVADVAAATGWSLEIIAGDEEARLSAAGARVALVPLPETYLLFDIGGGSTEFTLQQGAEILYHRSFPLGVVSLAERAPTPLQRSAAICSTLDLLQKDLAGCGALPLLEGAQTLLVGTAGTVTTLAALKLRMRDYDWRKVNNQELERDYLRSLHQMLSHLSCEERLALPGMEAGREDLIVAGIEIVLAILQRFEKPALKVSDFGLLEGVLLSLAPHS